MKPLNTVLIILFPILGFGQSTTKINKYSCGLEIDFGHSFTTIESDKNRWSSKFNPAATLNVLFVNRINQNLMVDLGIGFTTYGLIFKGPIDRYIIDFASPHISTGLSYNFRNRKGNESCLKLGTGCQLGYESTFVDEFETYKVIIQGKNKFYYFIKPEIGYRKYFKKRMRGSKYKSAYEFGTYFRYNLNTLGTVTIQETDSDIKFDPRGSIFGVFFKFLFPVGRKRFKINNPPQKELPPIIYNPRFI